MSKVVSLGDVDPKAAQKIFVRNMMFLGINLSINVGLPILVYYLLKDHMAPIWALLISSVPPLFMTIFSLIKNRRIDALSILVLTGFVFSAVLALIDGDPRLLLLRESAVTCMIGLAFLLSLIPITIGKFANRPLVFKMSQDSFPMPPVILADGTEMAHGEWLWQSFAKYRSVMRFMTAVWGVGLWLEFITKVILIQSPLTLDQLVYISNVVLGVVTGTLVLFTMLYGRRARAMVLVEVAKWKEEQASSMEM